MDVQNIVDELKRSLDSVTVEEELLRVISGRLTELRRSFPSNRSLFTPGHIEFLKALAVDSDQLRSFIDLKEELAEVDTPEEYTETINRLVDIKSKLSPSAVRKRVTKEIRELNEKAAFIWEGAGGTRQSRINWRIVELERFPRHCRHKHTMAIRNGRYGYFWGCSQYPSCQEAAQLTPDQKRRLLS